MRINIGRSGRTALFLAIAGLAAVLAAVLSRPTATPPPRLAAAQAAAPTLSRAALRRSEAGQGCPAVPATVAATPAAASPIPMAAALSTLMRHRVAAVSDLEHVIFDLLEGPSGAYLLVLASDVPSACEHLQHGADIGVLMQRASLGMAPLPADVDLTLRLRSTAAEGTAARRLAHGEAAGAAAGALRRALLAGEVRGATAVAIAAGHPLELAAAEPGEDSGVPRLGHPCPGLTPYVRTWVQSLPAGRPAFVAKKRRPR